ncbi:unnamed protein product, partial [Prorocentrum cordatum]
GGPRPAKLLVLMFERGPEFMELFDDLLDPSVGRLEFDPLRRRVHEGPLDEAHWASAAVLDTLGNAADFHMRLVARFQDWPFKAFFLIRRDPDEVDDVRKAIATELLAVSLIKDPFAIKLRSTFNDELFHASQTGLLDGQLYKLLVDVSELCPIDTDEIEGISGMIKHMSRTSPSIQLKLMSSRVVIKKQLQPRACSIEDRKRIISCAVRNHHAIADIQKEVGRFDLALADCPPLGSAPPLADADAAEGGFGEPPPPPPVPLQDQDVGDEEEAWRKEAERERERRRKCACALVLAIGPAQQKAIGGDAMVEPSVTVAFQFVVGTRRRGPISDDMPLSGCFDYAHHSCWLFVMKRGYDVYIVKGRPDSQSPLRPSTFTIKLPLETQSFNSFMNGIHDEILAKPGNRIVQIELLRLKWNLRRLCEAE